MKKLYGLVTAFQSHKDNPTHEKVEAISEILAPVVEQGVEVLEVIYATHHKIILMVTFHGVLWRVRVLPSFHGVELKVDGTDNGSKAELSRIFREAYPLLDQIDVNQHQYLKHGGQICPHCGSSDLEVVFGSRETLDKDETTEEVRCDSCGSTWTDVFELKCYRDLEVPETV